MSGNGLSPLYITGVDLNQYFVSNQTGEALANGKIYFYVDSNRTQAKNVFELVQGSGSPPNYTYVPLPNPLTLSAVGTIMDANGNNCALYYYPYDSFGNVQLYYIECYDQFGNLQFTREAWPYLSTTGGGMSGTINSAAQNSVAWYATTGTTVSGIPTANSSVFITSNTGVPGWTQTLPSAVQVTVNSLDSGTDADIDHYWNGSGAWLPIGGIVGSGWTLITSTTLSSTASPVNFTSANIVDYNNLIVEFDNVIFSTGAFTHMSIAVSVDGGSTYTAGSGQVMVFYTAGSALGQVNTSSGGPVQVDAGANGLTGSNATYGFLELSNSDVTSIKSITGAIIQPGIAGDDFNQEGFWLPMTQFNALSISLGTGAFTSGTIKLWGY